MEQAPGGGGQPPPHLAAAAQQQQHHQQQQQQHANHMAAPQSEHGAPPQQQQAAVQQQQQQQEPVNFHPRSDPYHPSRRVTIGGSMHAKGGDRRNSLSSMSFNMDDFFGSAAAGRRPSTGGDSSAFGDALFGRRESIDSSTAALDAAIFDLTRRRLSVAPSFAGAGGDPYGGAAVNHRGLPSADAWGAGGGRGSMDLSQRSQSHLPEPHMMGGSNPGFAPPSQPPQAQPSLYAPPSNLAHKQQQLQAQQRMLEQQQRELEMQRQELIASMQQRNVMRDGTGGDRNHAYAANPRHEAFPSRHGSNQQQQHQQMPPQGSYGNPSHAGATQHAPPTVPSAAAAGGGSQQWWICQVCNTKAFASHDEALTHEAICQGGSQRSGQSGSGGHNNRYMNASQASRNYSLGMDSSQHTAHTTGTGGSYEVPQYSSGPFAMMDKPSALSMPTDKEWLTPLHCFVRRHCVEVFTASEAEVAAPSKGKRKPIQVGQVGIRCPHCHSADSTKARERGSVYYPTTIASIYNATMNLLQRHLHSCTAVPGEIMRRYETLKADDARSGTSKRYWIESALSLGLVDTPHGIRFSALDPPPLPSLTRSQENMVDSTRGQRARRNSNDFFSTNSNAVVDEKGGPTEQAGAEQMPTEQEMTSTAPLTTPEDKSYSTAFSYHLLSQMQPCVFTEADRLGKRKGLPPGFPGLACRHCFGGYGSGRFFPSSIKTLSDTSKTLNVLHNHMMRCRKCPPDVRETLEKLRGSHDEERAKMKFGSQKAFFARIWDRLHGGDTPESSSGTGKRKATPASGYTMPPQQRMRHEGGPMQTAPPAPAAPTANPAAAAAGRQHL